MSDWMIGLAPVKPARSRNVSSDSSQAVRNEHGGTTETTLESTAARRYTISPAAGEIFSGRAWFLGDAGQPHCGRACSGSVHASSKAGFPDLLCSLAVTADSLLERMKPLPPGWRGAFIPTGGQSACLNLACPRSSATWRRYRPTTPTTGKASSAHLARVEPP